MFFELNQGNRAVPKDLRLTEGQWERLEEVYKDVKKYRKHTNRDEHGRFVKEE